MVFEGVSMVFEGVLRFFYWFSRVFLWFSKVFLCLFSKAFPWFLSDEFSPSLDRLTFPMDFICLLFFQTFIIMIRVHL